MHCRSQRRLRINFKACLISSNKVSFSARIKALRSTNLIYWLYIISKIFEKRPEQLSEN
jgi:hypothetical protein